MFSNLTLTSGLKKQDFWCLILGKLDTQIFEQFRTDYREYFKSILTVRWLLIYWFIDFSLHWLQQILKRDFTD